MKNNKKYDEYKLNTHHWWADDQIHKMPKYKNYETNSHGYRCPEFYPLPDGGKNVVVLGCSHTFGEGLEEHETWVSILKKEHARVSTPRDAMLRWWNLAYPGASGDFMARLLYGTEKTLFPKLIICCWPAFSRRERLDYPGYPTSLVGGHEYLKYENHLTDQNNFKKNFFLVEKFADHNGAKVFHCFADQKYSRIKTKYFLYNEQTLRSCWPLWDRDKREEDSTPDFASDGRHFGVNHHRTFARHLLNAWRTKLK